jgi:GntR family transcriptional regulator
LPPEREIAELTGFSRVTVRKAIQEMVKDGTIEQRQGSGSFVREATQRVEQSLSHLTSFTEDMANRGMQTTSRWLERGVFMPTTEEVATLSLTPDDQVGAHLPPSGGRWSADGPGTCRSSSGYTAKSARSGDVALRSACKTWPSSCARRPQKIAAVNLEPADAHLLSVPEGTAGLRIQRISYLETGRVAEFTQSIYRGDAYDFVAELRLSDR